MTTLYNSRDTLREFLERLTAILDELSTSADVIVVNDGSPTASAEFDILAEWALETGIATIYVDLARNFGHHVAQLIGLSEVPPESDLVFLIDSDLDEAPEWLADFMLVLADTGADSVYGYERRRSGGAWRRVTGAIYWFAQRRLSGLDVPSNIMTVRLMTKRYVNAVLEYPERAVSIGGLFALAGFHQVPVARERNRVKNFSNYSLKLKIWHMVNSITSFSTRPLEAIALVGAAIIGIGLMLFIGVAVKALLIGQPPSGWLSVLASLWLLGGVTTLSLGTIALYLSRIFIEVKARPRAIVRDRKKFN